MALKGRGKTAEKSTEETKVEETPVQEEKSVSTRQSAGAVATKVTTSPFITNEDIVDATFGASYGTFPSIVGSNGRHKVAGTDEHLGEEIRFQVIVAKEVKKVTPGSSDEEAKEYFQVSEDGETVNDGRSLQEAVQDAQDAGYEKAAIKTYIDVICIIVDCENEDYIGETVTLQLAPSSQFTWKPLAGKCKMAAATGKLKAEPVLGNPDLGHAVVFTSVATPTSWNGNDFTKFEFSI